MLTHLTLINVKLVPRACWKSEFYIPQSFLFVYRVYYLVFVFLIFITHNHFCKEACVQTSEFSNGVKCSSCLCKDRWSLSLCLNLKTMSHISNHKTHSTKTRLAVLYFSGFITFIQPSVQAFVLFNVNLVLGRQLSKYGCTLVITSLI